MLRTSSDWCEKRRTARLPTYILDPAKENLTLDMDSTLPYVAELFHIAANCETVGMLWPKVASRLMHKITSELPSVDWSLLSPERLSELAEQWRSNKNLTVAERRGIQLKRDLQPIAKVPVEKLATDEVTVCPVRWAAKA